MRPRGGKSGISVLVLTFNEEVNLPKCLESLKWSDDVVVLDSFSQDRTRKIADAAGVRFVQHAFTGFGDQRNWAFDHISFKNSWVLVLDADECVPPALAQEMLFCVRSASEEVAAFRLRRRFYFWGRWLRYSSLYPTWVVRLIRLGRIRYVNRGHAETQMVDGLVEALENDLIDENAKGMHEWWERQNDYSTKEALYELKQPLMPLSALLSADPLKRREVLKALARRIPFRAFFYFLYCYVVRMGFRDGIAGLRFALMKAMYTQMIQLKKYEFSHFGYPATKSVPIEKAVGKTAARSRKKRRA